MKMKIDTTMNVRSDVVAYVRNRHAKKNILRAGGVESQGGVIALKV